MLAYFTRRITIGLITLALLSLVLYTWLAYGPGGASDYLKFLSYSGTQKPISEKLIAYVAKSIELDKPWPLSYSAWLFNPEDTLTPLRYDIQGNPLERSPMGVDISLSNLQIKGSGALTGDFGVSWGIEFDTPVSNLLGPGIAELFTFLITLIAALMLIVTLQRWRRPPPYRPSTLPTSLALIDWHYQHSTSHLDTAILKRYWQ